jgi:hypothetical protein
MIRMLLKKLYDDLKKGETDIWSLDECHFYQQGNILAMWIPPEDKDPRNLHIVFMGAFESVSSALLRGHPISKC